MFLNIGLYLTGKGLTKLTVSLPSLLSYKIIYMKYVLDLHLVRFVSGPLICAPN